MADVFGAAVDRLIDQLESTGDSAEDRSTVLERHRSLVEYASARLLQGWSIDEVRTRAVLDWAVELTVDPSQLPGKAGDTIGRRSKPAHEPSRTPLPSPSVDTQVPRPAPKQQKRASRRPAERPTSTRQPQRADAPKSKPTTAPVPWTDPFAEGMVVPSSRRSPRSAQTPAAPTARPRANTAVRPSEGHEFIYTVTCVHCGAAQEMRSLELTYPRHRQRGRKNFICPWSNTRLGSRQIREASRRVVKRSVVPEATVEHPRPARKRERPGAARTVPASAKKPQTPPQRHGKASSSTRSGNSSTTHRDTAVRARARARRYFTSEYGDISDDCFRELGELNADSVSVYARLGPSQGTGRRR